MVTTVLQCGHHSCPENWTQYSFCKFENHEVLWTSKGRYLKMFPWVIWFGSWVKAISIKNEESKFKSQVLAKWLEGTRNLKILEGNCVELFQRENSMLILIYVHGWSGYVLGVEKNKKKRSQKAPNESLVLSPTSTKT